MWILQRICEGKQFYPLPANFNDFKRGVAFFNFNSKKGEFAVTDGKLISGLGSDFGLYKGGSITAHWPPLPSPGLGCFLPLANVVIDLVTVLRLVKDAKANIIEIEREQSPDVEESGSTLSPQ